MIVVDASVVVDLLTREAPETTHIRARLTSEPRVHVPHPMDAEVAHALRGLALRDRLAVARAGGHRARVELV